jgi:hypothetical protein
MDAALSYLVPFELVPVPDDWWAHAPGACWAEPDLDAAASAMRRVHAAPESARALGARARATLLSRNSPERTATFIEERFAAARGRIRTGSSAALRANVLRAAHEAQRGVKLGAAESSGRSPVDTLRRAGIRLLWPHLEEQQAFDREVVDALDRLERSRLG